MRILSTKTHGVLDYLVGALLIVAPYLFGFANGGPAQWVPMALGATTIVYSLLTDYELSIARMVPFPVHLALDGVSALLLLASPWLFGFAGQVRWPHVGVAILEIVVTLLTRTHSPRKLASRPV